MTLCLPAHTATRATTPDGVSVAVQDWNAAAGTRGRDVLFVHGYSQSHACWLHQVSGTLAQQFRLVTYDLRGHGTSDQPESPQHYQDPERWANELKAVIDHAGLDRPVVVAWSYAGRIVLDYLRVHGAHCLGALAMVSATSRTTADMLGPAASLLRQMADTDPVTSAEATRAFLLACVAQPLPPEDLAFMLRYNLVVSPQVRSNLRRASVDYGPVLQALRLPTLVIHGTRDTVNLPAMARYTQEQVRDAELLLYDNVGHLPFWEAPQRFDADLAGFINRRAVP